jgi:hypothetical protein
MRTQYDYIEDAYSAAAGQAANPPYSYDPDPSATRIYGRRMNVVAITGPAGDFVDEGTVRLVTSQEVAASGHADFAAWAVAFAFGCPAGATLAMEDTYPLPLLDSHDNANTVEVRYGVGHPLYGQSDLWFLYDKEVAPRGLRVPSPDHNFFEA